VELPEVEIEKNVAPVDLRPGALEEATIHGTHLVSIPGRRAPIVVSVTNHLANHPVTTMSILL
jgi:hypothetical protein